MNIFNCCLDVIREKCSGLQAVFYLCGSSPLVKQFRVGILLTVLSGIVAACSLPGSGQPAGTTTVVNPPTPGQTEDLDIPASILTEVAATMFAPYQATWTAQAIIAPMSTLPAQPPAPTQPAAIQPTIALTIAAPTQTPVPPQTAEPTAMLPTVAITPLATAGAEPLPTASMPSQPTTYQPALPPAQIAAQTGKAFTVFSLNLQNCGGEYAANFLIGNTGSQALESLSLHFIDLSTGQDLYDPLISNAPFSWTDNTCAPDGISRLEPEEWLFAGALLGPGRLSGHTILANFLFCTQDNLNGQCYPGSVEFVIP
jgi:type 1 fimbria pilin